MPSLPETVRPYRIEKRKKGLLGLLGTEDILVADGIMEEQVLLFTFYHDAISPPQEKIIPSEIAQTVKCLKNEVHGKKSDLEKLLVCLKK